MLGSHVATDLWLFGGFRASFCLLGPFKNADPNEIKSCFANYSIGIRPDRRVDQPCVFYPVRCIIFIFVSATMQSK